METEIKSILRYLRIEYILFWVFAFGLMGAYELEWLPQGGLAGDIQAEYLSQVVSILLTVIFIPLSLRMFGLSLMRYVRALPLVEALKSYRRWSEVRLALLWVAVCVDLSAYYWTMDTTGLLCAGMVLVAALFCVPGNERLKKELGMEEV